MTNIWRQLCSRGSFWYLISWDGQQHAGTLEIGKHMSREVGFRRGGNVHDCKRIDDVGGITFYPELRYRGIRFWPQHWDPESTEPMVVGFMPMNLDLAPTQSERDAIVKQLLDDGWSWSVWEGLAKAVHVDELEKIEGPPPKGAF